MNDASRGVFILGGSIIHSSSPPHSHMHYTHPVHTPYALLSDAESTLASCVWNSLLCVSITASCHHNPPQTPQQPTEQSQQTDHYGGPGGPNYLQPTKVQSQSVIYNPQSTMCEGQSAIYISTIRNPQNASSLKKVRFGPKCCCILMWCCTIARRLFGINSTLYNYC